MAGLMDGMANNPWIQFGTGMSSGQGGNWAEKLQSGMGAGIMNRQNQTIANQEISKNQLQQQNYAQELIARVKAEHAAEEQAKRNAEYINSLKSPDQRTMARAMGADDHATKMHTEQMKLEEYETYSTPKGPLRVPRWLGRQQGWLPMSVEIQSQEYDLKQKAEARAQGNYEATRTKEAKAEEARQWELEDALANEERRIEQEADALTNALETADGIADLTPNDPGFWSGAATVWGLRDRPFEGSDARSRENAVKTIQSKLGIDYLLEVKRQGGTFGALSEKELGLLVSKVQELDPYAHDFRDKLSVVRAYLQKGLDKDIAQQRGRARMQRLRSMGDAGVSLDGFSIKEKN